METEEHISNFVELGRAFKNISTSNNEELRLELAEAKNRWFTQESINYTFNELANLLTKTNLNSWLSNYDLSKSTSSKTIGLVLAGNIPLVGFHDIICTILTGHKVLAKLSSKDEILYTIIKELLLKINPCYKELINFTDTSLKNIDAIIATGSDNSSRYFDYYFGKYPNIIRKNRNSVAVIQPHNTAEDFKKLGEDIFRYFGLGCRNVSFLLIPEGFDLGRFFTAIESFDGIINHNKYANNYQYQKTLLAMNNTPFYDNGFCLLTENDSLASAIGTIHFKYYKEESDIKNYIQANKHKIQCIVSKTKHSFNTYSFGMAQKPALNDYADNIDTIDFLLKLK